MANLCHNVPIFGGPRKKSTLRGEVLEGVPLRHAPTNELGVVFIFAHLANKWRIRVDEIQPGFPDCTAYQKVRGQEKRIRIEFEFRSRNFKIHGHDPSLCDCIVCWEHNWPDAPAGLQIVELRREFGLGFNVWIMPTNEPWKKELESINSHDQWSLPSQCHKGDLILYYFTRPEKSINHVFVAADQVEKVTADWKEGEDYMGPGRRVCRLKAPIFLNDLREHHVLSTAYFVRCGMQGRPNATEYWPYLHDMILRRNPTVEPKLRRFAPGNV